jgi:ADP-ribosyl-[dinitrogen reductase] hydrolase
VLSTAACTRDILVYMTHPMVDARPAPEGREPDAEALRVLLDELFASGGIALRRSELFDQTPPALPDDFDFDRVEGMMLGLAIGDALGRPSEGRIPAKRAAMHGEIRDYVAGRRAKGARGLPSDDTQLAYWTLEQLLADRRFVPHRVATRLCEGTVYGMGQTVAAFRRNFKKAKLPWTECGPASAGNGALMRIAPIVIPHLREPSPALWVDTALAAMLTHNDSASNAACVAFVAMLWELLVRPVGDAPPERWWLERYVELARELETGTAYQPRGGAYQEYSGPVWAFVEQRVAHALRRDLATVAACDRWYSGAYLLETMPSVILILCRHGHDPEQAIIRAANDTKDNDTIAAIVGAAVGALHGRKRLPERWIEGLSGRTREADDGRVFELLTEARAWVVSARLESRTNR